MRSKQCRSLLLNIEATTHGRIARSLLFPNSRETHMLHCLCVFQEVRRDEYIMLISHKVDFNHFSFLFRSFPPHGMVAFDSVQFHGIFN